LGTKSGTKSGGYRTDREVLGPPSRQFFCAHPDVGVNVLPKAAPLAAATAAGITNIAIVFDNLNVDHLSEVRSSKS
jgi:hypothetical protein